MGTPTDRSSAVTDYYTRGDYIPGVWVGFITAIRESLYGNNSGKQLCFKIILG